MRRKVLGSILLKYKNWEIRYALRRLKREIRTVVCVVSAQVWMGTPLCVHAHARFSTTTLFTEAQGLPDPELIMGLF